MPVEDESIFDQERIERVRRAKKALNDYRWKRFDILKKLAGYKATGDTSLAKQAQYYEKRILTETQDPDVLEKYRLLEEHQVLQNMNKLMRIARG